MVYGGDDRSWAVNVLVVGGEAVECVMCRGGVIVVKSGQNCVRRLWEVSTDCGGRVCVQGGARWLWYEVCLAVVYLVVRK